ncbi:MAG: hypothetical protein MI743_21030 [Sneathiellales bacterium]|nr:hypothetical protein [Sneathiellales bacterium]
MHKTGKKGGQNQIIKIRLFGGFHAENFSGNPIDIPNRKAKAIIAYLSLNNESYQTRERLAGLLWSERSEEQARASLRQTIRRLRTVFTAHEIEPMEFGRYEISLNSSEFSTDIDETLGTLKQGYVPETLLETKQPLEKVLYGFEDLDSFFTSWLQVTRQTLANKILEQLSDLLRSPSQEKEKAARALLNIDNTNEEAYRALIRFHADNGNVTSALDYYKQLWDILSDEYDMEPSEETQQLISAIKLGEYTVNTLHNANSDPFIDSSLEEDPQVSLPVISVMQFELHGLETTTELQVTGLRYELIASLVKFRQWIILEDLPSPLNPSISSLQKPRSHEHLEYQLKGACFIDSGDARLVLTLIETISTRYIWSSVFSIELTNWTKSQQQIARQISIALNIHLTQQQLRLKVGAEDLPVKTYDKWLKGQALSFVWRASERNKAAEIFTSIMKERPSFVPAYSSFVQLENTRHIAFPGIFRSQNRELNTLEIAKTAIQKDPLDSRTQLCLAWSLVMNGHRDQAINHFWLAHDLNGNDPWTLISSACGLSVAGEVKDACRLAKQSLDLNPSPTRSNWAYQATIKFLAKDFEGCIASASQAQNTICYLTAWEAAAYIYLDSPDRAKQKAEEFFDAVRNNWHDPRAPTKETMAHWLWDCIPLYDINNKKCLQEGLQHAGIPVTP